MKDAGAFKNVSFQALQIVVNEQANTSDTMLIGGQGSSTFRFADQVTTRVIGTVVDIRRPEHVLRAQLDGSNVGVRNTNLIVGDGGRAFYASGFRYANVIVENALRTRWDSWPVTVSLEYQRNLRAVTAAGQARVGAHSSGADRDAVVPLACQLERQSPPAAIPESL